MVAGAKESEVLFVGGALLGLGVAGGMAVGGRGVVCCIRGAGDICDDFCDPDVAVGLAGTVAACNFPVLETTFAGCDPSCGCGCCDPFWALIVALTLGVCFWGTVAVPDFCGKAVEFTGRCFTEESAFVGVSGAEFAPGIGFVGFCPLAALSITAATGITLLFSSSSSSSLSSGDSSELAYFLFGLAFG